MDHTFTKVVSAHKDRLRFVGNVNVGKDVKVKELRDIYDVVLLAYGAAKDKTLGIKGKELLMTPNNKE